MFAMLGACIVGSIIIDGSMGGAIGGGAIGGNIPGGVTIGVDDTIGGIAIGCAGNVGIIGGIGVINAACA
jgi:hypothetical protein